MPILRPCNQYIGELQEASYIFYPLEAALPLHSSVSTIAKDIVYIRTIAD
jgi:hypothetical protein